MSLRTRLIGTSLLTLALGLGVLLVLGNTLLAVEVRGETSRVLDARADARLAALVVRGDGVRERRAAGGLPEGPSWVLSGARVVERPARVAPGVDRDAVALGREGRATERSTGR